MIQPSRPHTTLPVLKLRVQDPSYVVNAPYSFVISLKFAIQAIQLVIDIGNECKREKPLCERQVGPAQGLHEDLNFLPKIKRIVRAFFVTQQYHLSVSIKLTPRNTISMTSSICSDLQSSSGYIEIHEFHPYSFGKFTLQPQH